RHRVRGRRDTTVRAPEARPDVPRPGTVGVRGGLGGGGHPGCGLPDHRGRAPAHHGGRGGRPQGNGSRGGEHPAEPLESGDECHPVSHGGTMIQLTESAAGKVKELLVEEGRSDIALRVAVQPGGCSGLRYAMYLDDQLTEKDVAEEQFGVRVVIDRMSVPYLSEAKIDFVDSLEASGFTIDNPVATGSCACGHSFH